MTNWSKSVFANRFAKLSEEALKWFLWFVVTKPGRVMGTVSICHGDSRMEEALRVFMRKQHVWEPISDACS